MSNKLAYFILVSLAAAFSAFVLVMPILQGSRVALAIMSVVTLWFVAAAFCTANSKIGIAASLFLNFIFSLLLFAQLARRIGFIIENEGLDRADGYGSPMAFLLGAFFEIGVLILLLVFIFLLFPKEWLSNESASE